MPPNKPLDATRDMEIEMACVEIIESSTRDIPHVSTMPNQGPPQSGEVCLETAGSSVGERLS